MISTLFEDEYSVIFHWQGYMVANINDHMLEKASFTTWHASAMLHMKSLPQRSFEDEEIHKLPQ
jgi:hypothetical protein